jgi:hypothetical protein
MRVVTGFDCVNVVLNAAFCIAYGALQILNIRGGWAFVLKGCNSSSIICLMGLLSSWILAAIAGGDDPERHLAEGAKSSCLPNNGTIGRSYQCV